MIPVSALLQEAARYSRALSMVVDVWRGAVKTHPNVPVVSGTLTADRGSTTRLNCDITLAMEPWHATDIDTRWSRFHVSRGIESIGVAERLSLGWFRVDDVTRSSAGEVTLTGGGLESYVVDARFIRPRTPPWLASTVNEIANLIKEVMPTARIRPLNTLDRGIRATAPWEVERWDAVDALAESIDAQVYVDHTGDFVIADRVDLTGGVPVYYVNEGDGGVIVGRSQKDTRDQVYNAVSVSGSSSDPNTPPVWAWAYDSDPASPTYYYGDPLTGGFGQVPRFLTSQFFTTDAQCQASADGLLAQSLAANKTLSFTTVPISFLEVGDLVSVQMADGTLESHIIEKTSTTLGVEGAMSCETLASKVIAREVL